MSPDRNEGTAPVRRPSIALSLRQVELLVVDGPDRGKSLQISGGRASVGTALRNDLRLGDPTVSRVHFELTSGRDGGRLVDEGSTNGTFIEDVRVHDVELTAGATLRLGSTSLRLAFGEGTERVPLSPRTTFGGVVGGSVEMRRVYAVLERVAPTDATVLLQGETGTGKDVVARAIHDASSRASGPFVPIDCGAIAENLIESELFGHVRGAFSGAVADRRGVFEEADGGTLFFDEIGELPLSLQPKLLRVLEAREIRRVGANVAKKVDVRVIAATHRPLARSVNEGTFREDLYFRLAVVDVALPPLRARRDDIPLLAEHFLSRMGMNAQPIPGPFLATLMSRAWPGNVRELRNFMERSVVLGILGAEPAEGAPPSPTVLSPGIEAFVPLHLPLKEAREAWAQEFDAVYVRALLDKTGGNVTRAAEAAGVSRRFLQRMLARIGRGGGSEDDDEGGDE
jgi:transcriptional regulator with PAS, ATPase and Fis domain